MMLQSGPVKFTGQIQEKFCMLVSMQLVLTGQGWSMQIPSFRHEEFMQLFVVAVQFFSAKPGKQLQI